jgi:hypothetical protein
LAKGVLRGLPRPTFLVRGVKAVVSPRSNFESPFTLEHTSHDSYLHPCEAVHDHLSCC